MNNTEVLRDLVRRYQNTFMLLDDPKLKIASPHVVYCAQLENTPQGGTMMLKSQKVGTIIYNLPSDVHIRYRFPNVGSFQMGGVSFVFSRRVARQWRRGICEDNANISAPGFAGEVSKKQRIHYDSLEKAFEGIQYTIDHAFHTLLTNDNYYSCAVKGNYTLTRTPSQDNEVALYYMNRYLGMFDIKTRKVTELASKLFIPELKEMGFQL